MEKQFSRDHEGVHDAPKTGASFLVFSFGKDL
jgi:hypothetical protein